MDVSRRNFLRKGPALAVGAGLAALALPGKLLAASPGVDVPWDNSYFIADNGAQWLPNPNPIYGRYHYQIINPWLILIDATFTNTTVHLRGGPGPVNLGLVLPNGWISSGRISPASHSADLGYELPGIPFVMAGGSFIGFQRPADLTGVQPRWRESPAITHIGTQLHVELAAPIL